MIFFFNSAACSLGIFLRSVSKSVRYPSTEPVYNCMLYCTHYTIYMLYCTHYTIHICTVYAILYTLYYIYAIQCTHYTIYMLYCTHYTIYVYAILYTLYILYICYTVHTNGIHRSFQSLQKSQYNLLLK